MLSARICHSLSASKPILVCAVRQLFHHMHKASLHITSAAALMQPALGASNLRIPRPRYLAFSNSHAAAVPMKSVHAQSRHTSAIRFVSPLPAIASTQHSTEQSSESQLGPGSPTSAARFARQEAANRSEGDVAIKFVSDDIRTMAKPGENLWAVAERCNISIPLSCGRGDCGSCEMEVKKWNLGGSQAATSVVRTCIAAVPPGYDRLEIDAMEDAIWGADGFDT